MNKRIYLAGAMSCYKNPRDYELWREEAKGYLEGQCGGFKAIEPNKFYNYEYNLHKTEKEVMRFELYMVEHSDVVLVNLENLDKSTGTNDEIMWAYMHGIPVIGFLECEEEIGSEKLPCYIHPWKIEQITRIETGQNAMQNALSHIATYYSI